MTSRVKCRRFVRRLVLSVTIFAIMFFQVISISERQTEEFTDERAGPGVGQLERPDMFNISIQHFKESTFNVTNVRQNDDGKLALFDIIDGEVQSKAKLHVHMCRLILLCTFHNNEKKIQGHERQNKDKTEKCVFSGSFDDNINKLKSINFKASNIWMRKLGFDRPPANRTTSLPVLVTGANERFFDVIQGLIKSVHEKVMSNYPRLKFIVYDMGFTKGQHMRLKKYCRCEVRRLPFEDLPGHVRTLSNFAFKPIIINYIFQEFGHAWWVDSSVRFTTNNLDKALTYLDNNGALFFTYGSVLNVALHTHRQTFQHFDEDPCPYMYFGEVEAGNVAFINNEAGSVILNRWVSCALDASCLAPVSSAKRCPKATPMTEARIGACHRFDQSVLSIILRRLYHQQNDYPAVQEPIRIIEVKRGHRVNYFPNE